MSTEKFREYMDALLKEHILLCTTLLTTFIEELGQHILIQSFDRVLKKTLCAHHTVYCERSFTSAELQTIPRYLLYRYHVFGTLFDILPSGINSPTFEGSSLEPPVKEK
jgi:hypothetical protein